LLALGVGPLGRTPQHQPGGPARRQGLAGRLCHHREGLAPALASGRQALGLAETAGIGGDAALAPRVAPGLELAKQLDGDAAARIPAFQEIVLIRVEDTVSIVAAVLPHRPRRQAQIPLDGPTAAAHLGGNGGDRPALVAQGPYRLIRRLPRSCPLVGALLLTPRRGRWWDRDRDGPIGQRDRLLARGGVDRGEGLLLCRKDLDEGCRQILVREGAWHL